MSKATIFDVAELAGVSIKTVSRVVNREPHVRESTKLKVDKAIAALKYFPDQSARNLASHRSHLVGLVYDDPSVYEVPTSDVIMRLQQGALKACRAAKHELLIHPCDYRSRTVAAQLQTLIKQARPVGLVLAAPLSNMQKIVRAIEKTGTPFVRLSPGEQSVKHLCVKTNDREACATMTKYLAELGHARIAFIKGDKNHAAVARRFLGYQDGLEHSSLNFSQRLVAEGDNSSASGEACALKLLKHKNRPTAIFAANDDMAVGVIRVARTLGINVPTELSVAGFDDIGIAQQIDPTLTTIRQPLAAMAEEAARMLIDSARSETAQQAVVAQDIISLEAIVKIRNSSGPAPS